MKNCPLGQAELQTKLNTMNWMWEVAEEGRKTQYILALFNSQLEMLFLIKLLLANPVCSFLRIEVTYPNGYFP